MLASIFAGHRARRTVASLAFLVFVSCGPGGATPMPEPPALAAVDITKVAPDPGVVGQNFPQPLLFVAQADAAPSGALMRVTNLDTLDEPVDALVAADGSFEVMVNITPGNELRFQVISGEQRSAPRDARVSLTALTPVARPNCISVRPEYAVSFPSDTATRSLELTNTCGEAATVQTPRFRSQASAFNLRTSLPLALAPSTTAKLELTTSSTGDVEDVFFVDLLLGPEVIRYPITLYTSP